MVSRVPIYARVSGYKRARSKSAAYGRRTRAKSYVPRTIGNGAPAGQMVTMKYCQQVNMTENVIGATEQVFRGFSIFDPDLSGIGEQPLGHDQWANLYKRYRVVGSSIRCVFKNIGVSSALPQSTTVAVCLTDSSTLIGDVATCCEMPLSNWTMIGNADGGGAVRELSLKAVPQHIVKGDFGVKYDNDYTAEFGANPSLDSFYHIYIRTEGGSNLSVRLRVLITYKVWCYDPVQLFES